jgi:hypothetical protein
MEILGKLDEFIDENAFFHIRPDVLKSAEIVHLPGAIAGGRASGRGG